MKQPHKKPGRKPIYTVPMRTRYLVLPDTYWAALGEYAEQRGESLSSVARSTIFAGAKVLGIEVPEPPHSSRR